MTTVDSHHTNGRSSNSEPNPEPIPAIELQAFLNADADRQRTVARQVDEICRSTGFLIIRDHGVPDAVIDRAWRAARGFFDLSLQEKLEARPETAGSPRGYFPIESETLSKTLALDTPPDNKECFSSGPLAAPADLSSMQDSDFFYGPNIWPSKPPGFRNAWLAYYRAMERLGAELMQLFAAALELDAHYFSTLHSHHISALRTLNYPATDRPLQPGQRAAGEHSDYGSVTILKPDPRVPGLEIKLPAGEWCAAPPVHDGFVVNIGDMLARWTNDRWVSTLHRVTMPETGLRRQSIAYFQNPNYDAEIRCIPTCLADGESAKYSPVLAGPYLMDKFSATL